MQTQQHQTISGRHLRRRVGKRVSHLDTRFRTLLARVQCREDSRGNAPHSVGVIGFQRGVGASTVAANLAITAAKHTGCTVLLVDTDVENPTVAARLGGIPSPGLTDVLSGFTDLGDSLQSTRVENLWLMAAGDGERSLTCNREVTSGVLEKLKHGFDFVVFDLAPVTELGTGLLLPGLMDGVLLVVEPERTRTQTALAAKQVLVEAQAKLIGMVCNRQE